MTFNAYIKSRLTEALEPYGFIRIKGKYPYWVKLVNGEITHIITYMREKTLKPYINFSVWGGVATLYRKRIRLDINPMDQKHWMIDILDLCKKYDSYYPESDIVNYQYDGCFIDGDSETMKEKVDDAIKMCLKCSNNIFEEIHTVRDCIYYYSNYIVLPNVLNYKSIEGIKDDDEGIIFLTELSKEEYATMRKKAFDKTSELLQEVFRKNASNDTEYEILCSEDYYKRNEKMKKSIEIFNDIVDDSYKMKQLFELKEIYRKQNTNYLLSKGLSF